MDWATAGITGGASIINGVINRNNVKDTNATNMAIAKANNEAMLQAMRENNRWNRDTAKEFFDMENVYNDPSAVRQRLEDAGYNPFMDANSSVMNTGDSSTPQAQGVPALQAPTLQPVPSVLNGALADITSALVNVATAKKTGVDTKNAESMISRQIREMDINNDWNDFRMNLDKWFSWSDRNWQNEQNRLGVSKTAEEINSIVQDVLNKQKQGQIYDEELAIKQFNKAVAKSESEWIPKQLKQSFINAVKQGNAIDASADASRASAENSRASARLSDRQRELAGRTINGIEVSHDTLKNWETQLNNENITKNQRLEIQKIINEIEKGEVSATSTQWLIHVQQATKYVPVVGDILNFLSKFAK